MRFRKQSIKIVVFEVKVIFLILLLFLLNALGCVQVRTTPDQINMSAQPENTKLESSKKRPSIEGKIISATGAPISGVDVNCFKDERLGFGVISTAKTDKLGKFKIEFESEGEYFIVVSLEPEHYSHINGILLSGYITKEIGYVHTGSAKKSIQLKTGDLEITVLDENHTPISEFLFEVRSQNSDYHWHGLVKDTDGVVKLSMVELGSLYVVVIAENYPIPEKSLVLSLDNPSQSISFVMEEKIYP